MGDEDKEDGANGSCRERIQEAAAPYAEAHENPSADERADDAKNNVGDAAEAAAARDFSGKPSGDKADDDPAPESAGEINRNTLCLDQSAKKRGGHSASRKKSYSYLGL